MIPRTPAADPDERHEADEQREAPGEREEARPVHGVRPRMPALLRRNQLDRGRQRLHVVARLGHRRKARLAVVRHSQRLGGGVEHAVPALELRAVDGEVGLVDQLVGVVPVTRIRGDADRDRRADRLARGLDVEGALGDLLADALRDLERLLGARLREKDAELLAAEARRDVVVAQMRAEDVGDALQHGVAGEMAVRVVDVAQEVEVGHDQRQRPVEALGAHDLLVQREPEVARVEEAGLRDRRAPRPRAAGLRASGGSAGRAPPRTGSATGSRARRSRRRRPARRGRARWTGRGRRRAPTRGSSARGRAGASARASRGSGRRGRSSRRPRRSRSGGRRSGSGRLHGGFREPPPTPRRSRSRSCRC